MPTKTVKDGKATAEFETRTITLRGITYTMRELDVDEYEECLKSAEDERGFAEFGRLLKMMTIRAVSPSPAARERPLPYPIYRTLEQVVNVMTSPTSTRTRPRHPMTRTRRSRRRSQTTQDRPPDTRPGRDRVRWTIAP